MSISKAGQLFASAFVYDFGQLSRASRIQTRPDPARSSQTRRPSWLMKLFHVATNKGPPLVAAQGGCSGPSGSSAGGGEPSERWKVSRRKNSTFSPGPFASHATNMSDPSAVKLGAPVGVGASERLGGADTSLYLSSEHPLGDLLIRQTAAGRMVARRNEHPGPRWRQMEGCRVRPSSGRYQDGGSGANVTHQPSGPPVEREPR